MPARHMVSEDYRIERRAGLSGEELLRAAALKALCDAEDGLDLKVHPEMQRADANVTDAIIATTKDGTVIGACTLDGGSEIELCGMVHPAHRRRGVGRALLETALAACRERHARRVLLICEDASAAGRALLAAELPAARLDFKEHRLELRTLRFAPDAAGATSRVPGLVVRAATPDESDLDALALTQAAAFGERKQGIRPGIEADLRDPSYRYYLATLDGEPVSSLKVIFAAPRAFIYAFGVVPEQRRRGVGRAVLAEVIARLRDEGWRRVALEVESENAPALALYRGLGFAPATTYGYYAVPI